MDVIRKAADPKCSTHIVNSINTIDYILTNAPEFVKRRLKALFGLAELEHDADFAAVLEVRDFLPSILSSQFDGTPSPHFNGGKLNVGTRNLVARRSTISAKA